jgi:hypothetical protein
MNALLWLALLPLRLVFALLMITVTIVKFVLGAVFFLVLAPLAAFVFLVGLVVVAAVVFIPFAL